MYMYCELLRVGDADDVGGSGVVGAGRSSGGERCGVVSCSEVVDVDDCKWFVVIMLVDVVVVVIMVRGCRS